MGRKAWHHVSTTLGLWGKASDRGTTQQSGRGNIGRARRVESGNSDSPSSHSAVLSCLDLTPCTLREEMGMAER